MAPSVSDPHHNPFLNRRFFSVETSPVNCWMGLTRLRFAFDALGPRIEVDRGTGTWMVVQDHEAFRLAPEDVPYLTEQDLDAMVDLFKRSVRGMDPSVTFTHRPLVGVS